MSNNLTAKLSTYDAGTALGICEAIAEGKTLTEIVKTQGMPSRPTIYRWLAAFPEFAEAYERAREISAQAFEEQALTLAGELVASNDFTGTRVKSYEVAMGQLRWSAARRDPKRYGQRSDATGQMNIQINTSLNMPATGTASKQLVLEGEKVEGEKAKQKQIADDLSNIYSFTAQPIVEDAEELEPAEIEPEDAPLFKVEPNHKASPLQRNNDKRKMPKRNPRHKSEKATKKAITDLSKKRLSPAVKRALGITE